MEGWVMAAIRTQSLTKIYAGRQIALNCVDLVVEPGSVLAVLGRNGAGKTTLVKLLLGLQTPTAGRVDVFGQRMTPNAALLRQRIGYVPATPKFPLGLSPLDYLHFVGKLQGMNWRERQARVAHLLRAADMQRLSGASIPNLSTGMRSRLAIAASLIGDPDILIWDEPSQGLDAEARKSMLQLLRQLSDEKTLILCSHHLSDVQHFCTQALVLHDGQVLFNGALDALRGKAKAPEVVIELFGERKDIAECVKAIQQTEDFAKTELAKTTLKLQLAAETSLVTALVNALVLLQDKSVDVTDVRVSGGHAEAAIADLLQEEKSRGLTRAYRPVRR
jgi:ABC-2 type transport system ATP-binding protein